MQIAGRKALVIGAARSGIASARFLAQRGATVALNDRKPLSAWSKEALDLKTEGVGLIEGDPPSWLLDQIDLVVVSPGVPTKSIPIRYADRKGAEVVGEVELASRFIKGRTVAITGSNGKTTTTSLIGEMLKDAGLNVQVGGNIGTALISMIDSSRDDGWNVVEVSSFQLETIVDFHPTVATVLNVTPNHMDRYESLMDYAAAKHNIFRNQTAGDVAILNADDEIVSSWAKGLRAHVVQFSARRQLDEGLFLRGDDLVSRTKDGERTLISRGEMKLRGTHNVENVLVAFAAGLACGAPPESLRETVRKFQPVEHRLEEVAEIDGVRFVNDSKATSVDATAKALEAFARDRGKVILILGGRGKKAPYEPLRELIKARVRKMILIGEDASTIEAELGDAASHEHAKDMHDAVGKSFAAAEAGDVVLLAPACASFDMFESFEHRGRVFKAEVRRLERRGSSPTVREGA
ncbi:MAG TPA: UDP-N-acetylmuramoyl-L-alanine--D-glutamate ligase [Pyrinomonadaceae bacterium]|jgi:UDP-N-acetylmuramoylalanine--D-glutamate ligase|nr:UDP-N-acetylmuramoyl-L-alanine--D-glutamate ligase [Pyrinomonadaceae bacterium]